MSRYIDADKLQEDFKELHGGKRSLLIDTAPTADVRQNVKGEWLIRKYTTECSNCHTKWRDYRGLISTFYFCPDCGADMRGEA